MSIDPAVALELGDIQGTVLRHRPQQFHGVYLLYRVDDVAAAKAALGQVVPHVTSAADWESPRPFTLNVVFTWQGLRALGLPRDELTNFPEEFRVGMAARKEVLGDSGASDPSAWVAPLGSADVHVGVIISSETKDELAAPLAVASGLPGVTCIYRIDVGVPPTGREHFGFRDGISGPLVIGSGASRHPGQDATMPGEFVFGYPDESGSTPPLPGPEILARNGSFLAFRQLHCDVAAFRRFLRANARSKEDEELIAAKMMGRWRSGAPLMLAPEKDDPELAANSMRNNDFQYFDSDPKGLICPLGSHIRRVNPRDGLRDTIVNTNIQRVIRRGAAYGPLLPDDVLDDDGAERGIVFIFMGASLTRQFEFVQQVWMNDGDFVGLGTEKDPFVGNNDGTGGFTIPAKPIRRHLKGLPGFVTVRGGEYCFLPGLDALKWLAKGEYQDAAGSAGDGHGHTRTEE